MRPRTVSDEEILKAARTCLLTHGPSVAVATIAKRVGITGPAVLKRFGTKERLVNRALLSEAPPDLSSGPKPGPLRPQLVAILLTIERLLYQAAPRLATLRAGGVVASRLWAKAHPRLARRNLLAWLEAARRTHGLAHSDMETAADLLVSLVEARGFLAWIEPTWVGTGDAWAAKAVDALFGTLAITKRSPGRPPSTRSRRRR